ncbi:hypothetical protein J2X01_004379 [Arthrobacter ginsengisoli]|uniref:SMODS and SLOG-associating 2TM effector domain-containing protein n=1 Tax=Arthrobacter ginsengisoli TaxID=1356565 RepID=A0ABU1UIP6_9MICC|nr:hypothetical protein [Arthrobacter ginsengisoli]MDR7085059.1 hypothetical protein [Arthrobacter ginsengisoli]
MTEQTETRQRLSDSIEQRQLSIRAFLGRARPHRNRLVTISVVGSALAASLTAGPALGGTKFTTAVQGIFSLEESSAVWRVLCLAAVLLSLAAALATNLSNSHSVADRVSAAEACMAQLEGLRMALEFGHLGTDDAVQLYQQYVAHIGFVDRLTGSRHRTPG